MNDMYEKTTDKTSYSMGGGRLTSFPLKAILIISIQYSTGNTIQSKLGRVDYRYPKRRKSKMVPFSNDIILYAKNKTQKLY